MEKRIFLAIVLSIAVLVGWSWLAPKLFPELAKKPVPPKPAATSTTTTGTTETTSTAAPATTTTAATSPATSTAASPAAADPTVSGAPVTAPISAASVKNTVIDMPDYRAVFTNRGAQLVSFQLKDYKRKKSDRPEDLVKARDAGRWDYPFHLATTDDALDVRLNSALYDVSDVTSGGQRRIQYRYSDGRVTVTKIFTFGSDPYLFDYSVEVVPPMPYRVNVGPGIRTLDPEEQDTQVIFTGNGVYQREGKFKVLNREKVGVEALPGVEYLGIEDNYFLTALQPSHGGDGVLWRRTFIDAKDNKKRRIDIYAAVNAARDGQVAGTAFFGPKETELLDRYGLSEALQFGWFGLIARFFLQALVWINQYTLNYGFAIIVLTIIIKIVLYPLQHKSIVSMKKMQKVSPKMEAIKKKYAKARTDPEQRQKMNVEMMQLYQKEGINPMAGCLPLILQLPILWGFYNLLSRAIELRGAPWMLWIRDLSEKDPTYVLPILMTATMFLQTYLTPATGDPMQRRMFLIMPIVFGFLFKDFPSGLVLYWLVQNVLTIIQQLIMNKWWKDHPDEIQKA
jgi:YidC/Oxa1 family membrane protein insertase